MEMKTYIEIQDYSGFRLYELTQSYLNYLKPKDTNFSIFKMAASSVIIDGKQIEIKSDRIDEREYVIGKFYSIEDLKSKFGTRSPLYKNVVFNGLRGACNDINGGWQGVDDNTIVLDPSTIKYTEQMER